MQKCYTANKEKENAFINCIDNQYHFLIDQKKELKLKLRHFDIHGLMCIKQANLIFDKTERNIRFEKCQDLGK